MANFTDNKMDESRIQDTWFPAMDPITIEEACELRPKTWSLFHDEEQESAQSQQQTSSSQQILTPVLTESPAPFDTTRLRDSICVYKDRKTRSPRRVRRMPNELSEPTVAEDEASDHASTSLKSHSIRSQASSISKAVVKKVAKSFCIFMLCTPPDDSKAPPSRAISLPAKASTASKITHRFWTFVDGESRYPPQQKSDPRARSAITSTATINHIEGPDPTNTPKPLEAREAFPIFNTHIWNSAKCSSRPVSMNSQASKHTHKSSIPLPPTPYLTPHSSDREEVAYDHHEWIPEDDISPCTSVNGDGNSDCQTDVRRASDVHSQHSGWNVGGSSVASANSVYSRAMTAREQS